MHVVPPAAPSSDYTVVDRKGETLFAATAGATYTNQDWNFTAVGQYLYNGGGYGSLSMGDILQAAIDRAVSQPAGEPELGLSSLASTLGGLGKIGQHYGVLYLGWTQLWDSDWDFSVLAIENFSDWSGYVKPIALLHVPELREAVGSGELLVGRKRDRVRGPRGPRGGHGGRQHRHLRGKADPLPVAHGQHRQRVLLGRAALVPPLPRPQSVEDEGEVLPLLPSQNRRVFPAF